MYGPISRTPTTSPRGCAKRGIYDLQPALRWEDAFVSANGLYGILVYGDPLNETIIFNDHRFVNPNADFSQAPTMAAALPQVQEAALVHSDRYRFRWEPFSFLAWKLSYSS